MNLPSHERLRRREADIIHMVPLGMFLGWVPVPFDFGVPVRRYMFTFERWRNEGVDRESWTARKIRNHYATQCALHELRKMREQDGEK